MTRFVIVAALLAVPVAFVLLGWRVAPSVPMYLP